MIHEQFKDICNWQAATFKSATPLSKIAHLSEELTELIQAIESQNLADQKEEFADCFILLFGAAHSAGMGYYDICEAIQSKHEKNLKRQWGMPDENGVVRHIKEIAPPQG